MEIKEDLRIKKTKRALFRTFFSMLSEMTFEEMTINALCERAEVRRATFYKHYADKFDFLNAITRQLRDKFDSAHWKDTSGSNTKEYYVAYAKRVIGFVNEHDIIVKNMLKSDLLPTMMNVITEQNYIDTAERLRKAEKDGMVLKASPEVTAMMCAGGIANIIYHWIADGKIKDVNSLENEIGTMVSSLL